MTDQSGPAAPMDDDERDRLLVSLLRDHPDAAVTALDAGGRLVDVPSALGLGGHHVAEGASPFELVEPASRDDVVTLWNEANAAGVATATVHLVTGGVARCHVVDVRRRHGVFVGVMFADNPGDLETVLAEPSTVVPRIGRISKDEIGVIRAADDNICRILGFAVGELEGTRAIDHIHPNDRYDVREAWAEMSTAPGATSRLRARHRCGDGTWRWMELTNTKPAHDAELVFSDMIDISREMRAVSALRHSEQLLRRLADALPSGVLHVDGQRNVVYANARLQHVVGVDITATIDELLAIVIPEDLADLDAAVVNVLRAGTDSDLEVRMRNPCTAQLHLCAVALRALSDEDGRADGAVLCIADVTEAAQLRMELERRATVDNLTGCLNRATVLIELDRVLRRHAAGSPGTAVVFLDLDGFKEVNDSFGHTSGDQLLASVVTRLGRLLRSGDVIGRLGGDEFIVVLPSISGLTEAAQVGRRIEEVLSVPLEIVGGRPMRIRASIGVAWSAELDLSATVITSAADHAMYTSKRGGRSEPVCVLV
ncbi:MAG: sensor domain-containing diguanylate cyclase [Ilumatobacteraceae bacterium]